MIFDNPAVFQADDDNFVPPSMGGPIAVRTGTVEFTDTTAKLLFTLPSGAVPIYWGVDVLTDFDDTTGDLLEIGLTSDPDYFATALSIATAGFFDPSAAATVRGRMGVQLTDEEVVQIKYTESTGDASQGVAHFFLLYMLGGEVYVLE